jgi:hypothetical protein
MINNAFSFTEIIGYIASFTLLVSFVMKDITKLRVINTIGCALFVWYGAMLNFSIPIILTNSAIIFINIYYLNRSRAKAKS